ncbi:hypothetical protein B0A50_06420 [Salinomyces thailandicus]|uniref:Polysaccharide export protein n=1 Tax=Salinomyces thailandicus TaxID=706561 RepID=A0A4U0TQ87_9PEZI|nr:hypothetical protein B0A50_06420 [Salinomyces thailandica]
MLYRKRWRHIVFRLIRYLLPSLLLWTIYETVTIRNAINHEARKPVPPFTQERIFVASIHWTTERLLRSHWAPAIAQLARDLGPDNVFFSIYESGSFDDTKGVLELLKEDLDQAGVGHKVVLDETTHQDEVESAPAETGWIQMPMQKYYRQNWTDWFSLEKDTWVPRRIPYLARLRNLVMEPLYELQEAGQKFDRVLWLNDVVFNSDDVRRLLQTRSGDYAAACALDFKHPPAFYDTFATRDANGFAPESDLWPYFRSSASRQALLEGLPVPVASCWNGMVVFDAAPFYTAQSPLAFRGIADSLATEHLEGSECCLIHADNPLSETKGVWVNPLVRVAYNGSGYDDVHASETSTWPSNVAVATGLWRNRFNRWFRMSSPVDGTVVERISDWMRRDSSPSEPGGFCVIDEMQVLLWNGWGHA